MSAQKAASGEDTQNLIQNVGESNIEKKNERLELAASAKTDVNVSSGLWHLPIESKLHSYEYKVLNLSKYPS